MTKLRRGFTLVEMMVVLAIMAILAAIAVPQFQQMVAASRINSAANMLLGNIQLTRSEAIRTTRANLAQPGDAFMCRSLNAMDATPSCSNAAGNSFAANDWAAGWIMYVKSTLPGSSGYNANFGTGDVLVQRQPALASAQGTRVVLQANADTRIGFTSTGLRSANALPVTFSVDYTNSFNAGALTSSDARCLAINWTGRAELRKPTLQQNGSRQC